MYNSEKELAEVFTVVNCLCGHLPKLEYLGDDPILYRLYCYNPDCSFKFDKSDYSLGSLVDEWNELMRLEIKRSFRDYDTCQACGSEFQMSLHSCNDGISRCDACAQELILRGKADWC